MRPLFPLLALVSVTTGCAQGFTGVDVTLFADAQLLDTFEDAMVIRRVDFLTEYPQDLNGDGIYGQAVGLHRAPVTWWAACLLEDDGCTTTTSWGSRPVLREARMTYLTVVHAWIDVDGEEIELSLNEDPRPGDDEPQTHGYIELMEGEWGSLNLTIDLDE